MRLPSGLRALNHPGFRRYYSGQLVALVGTWMQNVAQAWLVLSLTGSPLRLGLIATLQFGPVLLFSVVTGALADRIPKRSLLVATQATQGTIALAIALLVWSGRVEYWHVGVLAVVWGLASAVDHPARQALVSELVGRADVVSAVALGSAAFNGARIIGPALAGVLIAQVGIAPAFALNALAFCVSIAALRGAVPRAAAQRPSGTTMLGAIHEGLDYARRTPRVRLTLGLALVASFCIFNFSVYVPLLSKTVLGLGAEGLGYLMACLGVGAVVGALTLGTLGGRLPSPGMIAGALVVACAGLLGLGWVHHVWTAALLLALTGFAGIVVVAACNTSLQLLAPDALRGRVMSLYTLVSGGIFPVGAFWVGALSQVWDVSTAFRVNGVLGLGGTAALALWWRLRQREP
ncbi:MAG: MFS transporter [Candidatus Rokuibacteriota bacterium]